MAMATSEPTRAPTAAQTPSKNIPDLTVETSARCDRGELTPWDIVCRMEEPLFEIADLVSAIQLMGEGLDDEVSRAAFNRIVMLLGAAIDGVQGQRDQLFNDLHPRRGEPDFDDGNGNGNGNGNGEVGDVGGADHA